MTAPSVSLVAGAADARDLAARALRAALAVFTLDGLYVIVVFAIVRGSTTPLRIFQGIAAALLGPSAMTGGTGTAMLGVLMHFGVSLGWTLAWLALYERSPRLRALVATTGRALPAGVLYGVLVHLAMQRAILPLTQARVGSLVTPGALLVLLAHVTVIGPVIVLVSRRSSLSALGSR